jgi:hypothetical protein
MGFDSYFLFVDQWSCWTWCCDFDASVTSYNVRVRILRTDTPIHVQVLSPDDRDAWVEQSWARPVER